jgi:hypothetical protein
MKPDRIQPEDDGQAGLPAGEVASPSKITKLHVRARPALDDKMRPITGKTAWTKWTPLEAAFQNGKLQGGDSKYSPIDRFNAGKKYEEIWDLAQSAGRDSTQAFCISRGFGGGSIGQTQSDAVTALVRVDSHLSQRDRIIIRMVCGEGHFPSEAVAMVSADYVKATAARFREALDSLIEAFEKVRKQPGRVAV